MYLLNMYFVMLILELSSCALKALWAAWYCSEAFPVGKPEGYGAFLDPGCLYSGWGYPAGSYLHGYQFKYLRINNCLSKSESNLVCNDEGQSCNEHRPGMLTSSLQCTELLQEPRLLPRRTLISQRDLVWASSASQKDTKGFSMSRHLKISSRGTSSHTYKVCAY